MPAAAAAATPTAVSSTMNSESPPMPTWKRTSAMPRKSVIQTLSVTNCVPLSVSKRISAITPSAHSASAASSARPSVMPPLERRQADDQGGDQREQDQGGGHSAALFRR